MLGRGGTDIVPTFVFLPFGERAKMQVVETSGGLGADLAASDGGEELAVKGNRHLFELERESGNGSGQVAWRIAVGGIVRPLRSGQDNGFVQTLQREGEEVGGVCHGIRAVQHQNAVIVRQLGDNKLQPVALVLQRYRGRIDERLTNVPFEIKAV